MLYYRFRAPSEISFKELLYDEMYFMTTNECNDPFDSQTYCEFEGNPEKWKRLLRVALKEFHPAIESEVLDKAAQLACDLCPITFDKALSMDVTPLFRDAMKQKNEFLALTAALFVRDFLRLYRPSPIYFVSFSKSCKEPLMWSHYAARHEGFCLIFRPIDEGLSQCRCGQRKAITRRTPKGFAQQMSWGIPESFKFQDVTYVSNAISFSAFNYFPGSVAGDFPSKNERERIFSERESQYLQKHVSWEDEKEARLTMKPAPAWLLGSPCEFSEQERLLHFEPTQLVGIVLGSRINQKDRQRIIEIIKERQERISRGVDYKRVIFDFVLFESKMSTKQREVEIVPYTMFKLSTVLSATSPDFAASYRRWLDGWGLEMDGHGCSSVCLAACELY
jgi:hypothetical protein